jgi:hypothetical protein
MPKIIKIVKRCLFYNQASSSKNKMEFLILSKMELFMKANEKEI